MSAGARISGWVAAAKTAIVNGDAALELFDAGAIGLRSATAVCVAAAGGTRVVTLYSALPAPFSPAHVRLVESAAAFVAEPTRHGLAAASDVTEADLAPPLRARAAAALKLVHTASAPPRSAAG